MPYACNRWVIADLASGDRVLIWAHDSYENLWKTPRATIFRGKYEVYQLFHSSDAPPIWVLNTDFGPDSIVDIFEDQVGKRCLSKFLKRLRYSPKVWRTRFIKRKTYDYYWRGKQESTLLGRWTGSVLRVYVPDTVLQSCPEVSKRYFLSSAPADNPLVLALLDIPVGVHGVEVSRNTVDIALDEHANPEGVTRAVFEVLNCFRV